MTVKGLVETVNEETEILQSLGGAKKIETLLKCIMDTIIQLDAKGISYHLQLESVQLIIVLLSSPLYGRPSRILNTMLSSGPLTDLAAKLSQKLCEHFIANSEAPLDIYEPGNEKAGGGSFVLSIASGLWNILTLGYSSVQAATPSGSGHLDEEIWSKKPLADLAVLLQLLLINHSSANNLTDNGAPADDHCYRMALYHCYSHKGKF